MSQPLHAPDQPPRERQPEMQPEQQGAIDIEALADRVYRLMREEARLERARGVPAPRRRKG
ncbi:MAG: hypothetical protein HXY39_20080 [Chloroflexi bacterium]|nr:hypothetical protein [Chloroflexota bacterium]